MTDVTSLKTVSVPGSYIRAVEPGIWFASVKSSVCVDQSGRTHISPLRATLHVCTTLSPQIPQLYKKADKECKLLHQYRGVVYQICLPGVFFFFFSGVPANQTWAETFCSCAGTPVDL